MEIDRRPDDVDKAFRAAMRLGEDFTFTDAMSFDDVPGWDSVGHMNLVTELESRFGVSLDMDEIVAMDSVGAVRQLLAKKRGS